MPKTFNQLLNIFRLQILIKNYKFLPQNTFLYLNFFKKIYISSIKFLLNFIDNFVYELWNFALFYFK